MGTENDTRKVVFEQKTNRYEKETKQNFSLFLPVLLLLMADRFSFPSNVVSIFTTILTLYTEEGNVIIELMGWIPHSLRETVCNFIAWEDNQIF